MKSKASDCNLICSSSHNPTTTTTAKTTTIILLLLLPTLLLQTPLLHFHYYYHLHAYTITNHRSCRDTTGSRVWCWEAKCWSSVSDRFAVLVAATAATAGTAAGQHSFSSRTPKFRMDKGWASCERVDIEKVEGSSRRAHVCMLGGWLGWE